MVIMGLVLAARGWTSNPEYDSSIAINSKRLAKIEKKEEETKNSEQYVLLAVRDGSYPCYNCPTGTINLIEGDVFKYG